MNQQRTRSFLHWRSRYPFSVSRPSRLTPATGESAVDAIPDATPRVVDVMTANPIVLKETDPVAVGGLQLLREGISGAPVVGIDGALVGVFSHSDVLARFAAPRMRRGPIARLDDRRAHARTVGEACTRPPVITSPEASLATAAREMLDRDIGRLIVVDDGRIVGIISRSNMLKQLLRTDSAVTADDRTSSHLTSD